MNFDDMVRDAEFVAHFFDVKEKVEREICTTAATRHNGRFYTDYSFEIIFAETIEYHRWQERIHQNRIYDLGA